FECRVDDGDWEACGPDPYTYDDLLDGSYVFEVRAIDEAGNADPTPGRCVVVYDGTPPDTFIPVHPDDPSQSGAAVFGFGSDESPVTYHCVLDPETTPPSLEDYVDCDQAETFTG